MKNQYQEKKSSVTGKKPLGFSGAKIITEGDVTEKRQKLIGDQGQYCKFLGSKVCPRIISISRDSYTMQTLQEAKNVKPIDVLNLLEKSVWTKGKVINPPSWKRELEQWLIKNEFGFLIKPLYELYKENEIDIGHIIHGDPTLSNCMATKRGELRLIDPIFPTGKIPSLIEVDLAKVMQSKIGWENVLQGDDFNLKSLKVHRSGLSKPIFWLMIHLCRIVPYSIGRPEITRKLKTTIREIYDIFCI